MDNGQLTMDNYQLFIINYQLKMRSQFEFWGKGIKGDRGFSSWGRVINIEDIIVFDGLSVDELEPAFKTVIEQYLTDCQTLNKNPNQPTYSLSSHER